MSQIYAFNRAQKCTWLGFPEGFWSYIPQNTVHSPICFYYSQGTHILWFLMEAKNCLQIQAPSRTFLDRWCQLKGFPCSRTSFNILWVDHHHGYFRIWDTNKIHRKQSQMTWKITIYIYILEFLKDTVILPYFSYSQLYWKNNLSLT